MKIKNDFQQQTDLKWIGRPKWIFGSHSCALVIIIVINARKLEYEFCFYRNMCWFGSWSGKWNNSWQWNNCFFRAKCQHTSQEWSTELLIRIIMVCRNKWHQPISTNWPTDTLYHLRCVHSREFSRRSLGEELQTTIINRWWELDGL